MLSKEDEAQVLRMLADLFESGGLPWAIVQTLRDEAARREAGKWQTMKCTPDKPDTVHYTTHPDAPPPPADERAKVAEKLLQWSDDLGLDYEIVTRVMREAAKLLANDAAAIEALRAREKALEAALQKIADFANGEGEVGNYIAEMARAALAAGGADA